MVMRNTYNFRRMRMITDVVRVDSVYQRCFKYTWYEYKYEYKYTGSKYEYEYTRCEYEYEYTGHEYKYEYKYYVTNTFCPL